MDSEFPAKSPPSLTFCRKILHVLVTKCHQLPSLLQTEQIAPPFLEGERLRDEPKNISVYEAPRYSTPGAAIVPKHFFFSVVSDLLSLFQLRPTLDLALGANRTIEKAGGCRATSGVW